MASSAPFQSPRWYWFALVGFGLTNNYVIAYHPSLIPYQYLGPIGTFLHFMAYDLNVLSRLIFIAACVVHVGEGLYGLTLARSMNASVRDQCLWFLQTTLLGYPSLRLLKKKKKQKQATC